MTANVQSGADVVRGIERAVEPVRQQLDDHVAGVHTLNQQVNDLVARRGGALLDLAKHYLPNISEQTVQQSFVEIRNDLLEVLARKQRRERDMYDQVAAAQRQSEHQEAELGRITEALNAEATERQRLEGLVAERFGQSVEFKSLSEQALAAEAELDRNERRAAEIKAQVETNLPSFERNRLFKYLHDVGYGSGRYNGHGLARRIDDWVARMIDFPSARRGYDFLCVTPELIQQEVARRRERFNELMQQVETMEDRVSDELGLTEVMRAGQELGAERDRAVTAAASAQDVLFKHQQDLLNLAGSKNEFYEQALARMQTFLAGLPPTRLAVQSRATPERDDDAIVAEVSFLSGQLTEADHRGAALARQRQTWDERLRGLQSLLQQFRSAEFDSQRSLFPATLDAEQLANEFLEGRLSTGVLWTTLQREQQFAPEWHEQPTSPGRRPSSGGRNDANANVGDVSQVLLHALSEVASPAMRTSASRGMERRAPTRSESRQTNGRPPFPNRGFTSGRGF